MRVKLFLMGYKGFFVLENLVEAGRSHAIAAVVAARDSAVEKDYFEEIRELATRNKIPFFTRTEQHQQIAGVFSIAISWRWIIKDDNLIVLHDSLLPRYRGFAPVVSCLVNGEKEIGATALFASEEYDRGDIIFQSAVPVEYPIKIQEAIEKLSMVYWQLVDQLVSTLVANEPLPRKQQDETLASYSLWRDDQDYRIDWSKPAQEIKRFIDAVGFPYKGAAATVNGDPVRIKDAIALEDVKIENRTAGKIIFMNEGCPVIVCGSGLLRITDMCMEDGKPALPLTKFRSRFY